MATAAAKASAVVGVERRNLVGDWDQFYITLEKSYLQSGM